MTDNTDGNARTETDLDQQSEFYDYDPDDYDDYDDYYDDDDGYSVGYADGYVAAMRSMAWRYRLTVAIPYRVRAKYYALRRRLFPKDSDIPF